MRSVEEHRRVVAGLITRSPPVTLPLADTLGVVLADDVVAPLSLPGFDNSAMDGYAVVADDVATATPEQPVLLPVAEDIPAGRTDALTLKPGTAHRIMTGAPVPAGATAVVPVEATDGATDTVTIRSSAKPDQHIRRAGEDVTAGTTVLRAGSGHHPCGTGPGRRARPRRADRDSPAAGSGDVDRDGVRGSGHPATAGPDLRIQRGDACGRHPGCGRRSRGVPDGR